MLKKVRKEWKEKGEREEKILQNVRVNSDTKNSQRTKMN